MTVYCTLLLQCNLYNLEVCKAVVSDPDTLPFDQILLDPDLDKWKESASKEIKALESKGTWKEVPMHEAKSKILLGTWVFRRKKAPTGVIKSSRVAYVCVEICKKATLILLLLLLLGLPFIWSWSLP